MPTHPFKTTQLKCLMSLVVLMVFVLQTACNQQQDPTKSSSNTTPSNNKAKAANVEYDAPLFSLLPSSETGITFGNFLQEDIYSINNVLSYEYYYMGAGLAVGDINNDDLPDIFFCGNNEANRLYLNRGNFQFEDITEKAGVGSKRFTSGATMADVNNDGLLDIYVNNAGPYKDAESKANELYINKGDGDFVESAAEYGVNNGDWSVQSAFFDYDKDGDLDLFVSNHSTYFRIPLNIVFKELENPETLYNMSSKLYRNDNGKFKDVTREAGLVNHSYGLGLVIADINDDGYPDIYQANDYSVPDRMYINQGNGKFVDEQKTRTKHVPWFGMGADISDFNNDGFLDIASVDMAAADHIRGKTLMASMDTDLFWGLVNQLNQQYQYMFNTLQVNNGNGTFSEIANMTGTAKTDWSWTALFMDVDNDGWKDYLVSNGMRRYALDNDFRIAMEKARQENGGVVPDEMRPELWKMMPEVPLSNHLYRNNGDLTFTDKAEKWDFAQPSYSTGAAYADFDGDGDLDFVMNNTDMEAFIYRNNANELTGNNYLRLQLLDNGKKATTLNAKVTITSNGNQIQHQELTYTRGYQSAVEEYLHFGLGKTNKVDKIEIKWLDGKEQILEDVAVNQLLKVDKKDAKAGSSIKRPPMKGLFSEVDLSKIGVDFQHRENRYDDFKTEILLPHKQSMLGPFVSVSDVNKDGLEDFYIGGAAGQSGVLYLQAADATFYEAEQQPWSASANSEDMYPLFFDADNNGTDDLYIVSGGGGEMAGNEILLEDRLYVNFGEAGYKQVKALPEGLLTSGMKAKAADFDGDGDMDIFVGGRTLPQKYPFAPRSYLLRNDNKRFNDVTDEFAPDLQEAGMITDFQWTDFNKDGQMDLIVVGEWMPISFYQNEGGKFTNVTADYGFGDKTGWWYSLEVADIDGDGDEDLIAGNVGLNNKFNPSPKKPLHVYADDFDGTGSFDIVLSKDYKGKLVPVRGRECSSEQMPFVAEKFPTYNDFAHADLEEIYGEQKLENSLHLQVNDFRSMVFLNDGNQKYTAQALPNEAQVSPINGIVVADLNQDGNKDLVVAGNMYHAEVETPRYDAGNGLVLLGDGKGNFNPLNVRESGFFAPKDVKDLALIRLGAKKELGILVANNNGGMQLFRLEGSKGVALK